MDTTAPLLPACPPSSSAFSLLSTRRWAMRAAKPTPSTSTRRAAAPQIRCSRLMRGCCSGCCGSGSVETLTHLLQVGGQRGLEPAARAVGGVVEGELVGVEERTFHGQSVATTVAGVPDHGMADGSQMHTHLVGATRLQ